MSLAPVIDLLRQKIGLDPDSLGPTTLPRAVAARMQALGLAAPAAYASRLVTDEQEFQALLGHLAVPESWFFRGGEVFGHLARQAAEVVRLRGGGKKFRALSVPCSTGEEPYSFAVALAELGVTSAACEIEAVDLSAAHVEKARRGVYSEFSFRQTVSPLRDRYFRAVSGGWELDPVIRTRVRFRQGNLLEPLFLAGEERFDLIFCRNLFIYLHADARRQALNTIERLLAPAGWLCTGHAEPIEFRDARFMRSGPGEYFLYRRASDRQGDRETRRQGDKETVVPIVFARLSRDEKPDVPPVSPSPCLPVSLSPGLLTRARQEADTGKLADALASCQEQLARHGPSADLYSLMGVIHQARREMNDALRCYQRALYLEREHAEAMTHLMLLFQEQGEATQAERLRRRLERVAAGGEA
jgi:chemotaxis protein methyltransferase WspC